MCHLKSATIVHHNIITWIYMFACQLNIRVEQNCFLFCDFLTYCRVDDLTGLSVPTNNRKKKTHWPSDNCSKVCVSNFDHRDLTITRLQSFGEHPYLWKKYTFIKWKRLRRNYYLWPDNNLTAKFWWTTSTVGKIYLLLFDFEKTILGCL